MPSKSIYTLSSVVCRSSEQVFSTMDDDIVMMNINTGNYFGLNPVAGYLWQRLEQPVKLCHLIDELCRDYDVSREQAEADVLSFIHHLAEYQLIDSVPSDA